MIVPCVSCQSMFQLDNTYVRADGSKVRCSKCHDIFMVFPPEHNIEPCSKSSTLNTDETVIIPNVKHSLLDDLFQRKNKPNELVASTGKSTEPDDFSIDSFDTIEDFEEAEENQDNELADLPDLSEIEEAVDSILDENDYLKNFSPYLQTKYSLTPDLYFNGE